VVADLDAIDDPALFAKDDSAGSGADSGSVMCADSGAGLSPGAAHVGALGLPPSPEARVKTGLGTVSGAAADPGRNLFGAEHSAPGTDPVGRISPLEGLQVTISLLFPVWACICCTSSQLLVALDTLDRGSNTNPPPAEYKNGGSKEISACSLGLALDDVLRRETHFCQKLHL
jgi:hypothetical protein